ncbi:flagellar cap protein FliD N-terminal domain-containing protein, partial [Pseudoalteromonas sp. S983]
SAGIGSGLDLESIISATVSAERNPKLQRLLEKEDSLKVELSSIGEVKSALSKLQDTFEKLADMDNFGKRTANITQPSGGDLISATPSSSTSTG